MMVFAQTLSAYDFVLQKLFHPHTRSHPAVQAASPDYYIMGKTIAVSEFSHHHKFQTFIVNG
jgi:hypothetical protein